MVCVDMDTYCGQSGFYMFCKRLYRNDFDISFHFHELLIKAKQIFFIPFSSLAFMFLHLVPFPKALNEIQNFWNVPVT